MPRHDVHDGPLGLLLDCQSDATAYHNTRLVAPLRREHEVPRPMRSLHTVFEVAGERLLMATHLASAVPVREFGPFVGTLADEAYRIGNAFDMLQSGI